MFGGITTLNEEGLKCLHFLRQSDSATKIHEEASKQAIAARVVLS